MRSVALFRIGGLMEIVGTPPNGVAGVPYSYTFSGLNGSGSYAFQFTSDPIVFGWSAVGGTLSNPSPTADDYIFTVTLIDTANHGNNPVVGRFPISIV